MPIKIPDRSPSTSLLRAEGVDVIGQATAARQDIRPLRVLLLNLMPAKVKTEVQLARLLSHTPLQIELFLLTTESYQPTTTSAEYMNEFYCTLADVCGDWFDGMIITGAPVERMPFESVAYWRELCAIFDWARRHVFRRFHICWGAQAALYYYYGISKQNHMNKIFGVYEQRLVAPDSALLRGFSDAFPAPVSRYSGIKRLELEGIADLQILAEADPPAGVGLLENRRGDVFMLNHLEYDTGTLAEEFFRDVGKQQSVQVPVNYFDSDDPSRLPLNRWRPFGYLLFSNWIYKLYEDAPFNPEHPHTEPTENLY
jgi:homoserine O-succinyltransferase